MKTVFALCLAVSALVVFLAPRPIAAGEAEGAGFVLESLDIRPSGGRFDVSATIKNASGRPHYDVALRLTITDGTRPLGAIVLPKVAVFPQDATMTFAENSGHALDKWTAGRVEVALEGEPLGAPAQSKAKPKLPVPLQPNPGGVQLRDLRFDDSSGSPRIAGTITNRTGRARANARVTLYFYDADEYLLGAVDFKLTLFPRGMDVQFSRAAPPEIEGWATWRLELHPHVDFEIEDFAVEKVGRDWRVTGELFNNTMTYHGLEQLTIRFYDTDGFLITKNNILVRNLYASGSVPVTIVTNSDLGKLARYEIEKDTIMIIK